MNASFYSLEDNISYIKEYIVKISRKKSNIYWIMSDVDVKFNDMSEETDMFSVMKYYEKKFLDGEIIKLTNEELISLLDNIYEFEFGVIICFECDIKFDDLYINKHMVGECFKLLPYSKDSLVEIRVFEENLDIYVEKVFYEAIGNM